MRERKVTALYCDHCNKRGFQRPAMERHERSCTANPDRVCRMCKWWEENDGNELHGLSVPELRELIRGKDSKDGLKALREATGNCPACILSVVRAMNKENVELREDRFGNLVGDWYHLDFDWDAERVAWSAKVKKHMADERMENCAGYY